MQDKKDGDEQKLIKKIEKEFKTQIEALEKKKTQLLRKLKKSFTDISLTRLEYDQTLLQAHSQQLSLQTLETKQTTEPIKLQVQKKNLESRLDDHKLNLILLQKKNENYEASAREISKQLKLKEAEVLPNAGKN